MNRYCDDHNNHIKPELCRHCDKSRVYADVRERVGLAKGEVAKRCDELVVDVEAVNAEVMNVEEDEEAAECEGEIVEITEQEAEEEREPIRIAPDPGLPSAEDMEKHRAEGHVPFKSWCE